MSVLGLDQLRPFGLAGSAMNSAHENGDCCGSRTPALSCDGCPGRLSFATLETWLLSDRQLLDFLSRMPFIDSAELAGVLGEAHATVHRALAGLFG